MCTVGYPQGIKLKSQQPLSLYSPHPRTAFGHALAIPVFGDKVGYLLTDHLLSKENLPAKAGRFRIPNRVIPSRGVGPLTFRHNGGMTEDRLSRSVVERTSGQRLGF